MVSIDQIRKFFRGYIGIGELLAKLTTFKIGGPADFYLEPLDAGDLAVLVNLLSEHELPFMMIGNGSNMLVSDFGYRGAAINIERGLSAVEFDGEFVKAGAGIKLAKLVDFCVENGLHGVETLAGIPGTLGGAILTNAGAYGETISDYLFEVEVIRRGELKKISKVATGDSMRREAAAFSYMKVITDRYSSLENDFVVGAAFRFPQGDKAELKRVRRELILRRNELQPVELPNAGRIFKNPGGKSAGKLIENCGLKGFRIGNAQFSTKHANFVVNLGGASAVDVLQLIKTAQEKVNEKSGVMLELDVKLMGFQLEELAIIEA